MLHAKPIAIQGMPGSFHAAAVEQFFSSEETTLVPCETFREVFAAVTTGRAETGIVAVENSLYGSIHEVYDELVSSKVGVAGEVTLAIHQQLIGHPNDSLATIQKVYSHPAALDQCRDWLDTHLPAAERVEYYDTAGAVAHIKTHDRDHAAAIASVAAATLHDMPIIASNIEDSADNFTRFVVITKNPQQITHANKASLILITPHTPGSLHAALGVFARHHCNLTKLESRPIRGESFHYQFIVDVLADRDALIDATVELAAQDCQITLLGHYKAA